MSCPPSGAMPMATPAALPTRTWPAGGLRGPVRPAAFQPGAASWPARLPAGLLPRGRNKTLTALAGAEPTVGAQHREVQRLQWFVSESTWDHERVNQQRVGLLQADPATAPHGQGVLVTDDTGGRKDGRHTAHVARQYLGSVGKTDNGIVCVTSLWADARCYWPLH